jgi:hypothetical protein
MTRKDRQQRINLLKQQLTLIKLLREEFEEKLRKNGVLERIDEILDELKYHINQLDSENDN